MLSTRSIALTAITVLAACSSKQPLHGNWKVNGDATIQRAVANGFPEFVAQKIREIYDGGRLEIGRDTLILRIQGHNEAEAHNYKVVGKEGNCYKLEITRSEGVHSYCVDGAQLVVEDPNAKLAVVFERE